jgi:soluble lytic murein transglycosylase
VKQGLGRWASSSLVGVALGACGYCGVQQEAHSPSPTSPPPEPVAEAPEPVVEAPQPASGGEATAPSLDPLRLVQGGFQSGDYQLVARVIDAASEEMRVRPEVRLARAHAAFELDDVARARHELDLLAGPQFLPEIAALRKHLAWKSPEPTRLGTELESRTDPEAQLLRAIALGVGGEERRSILAISAWLSSSKPKRAAQPQGHDLELRARLERSALSARLGAQSILFEDYRYLATEHPDTTAGEVALRELSAKGATLSSTEKKRRLLRLAERGKLEELKLELGADKKSKPELEVLRARASALYQARRYEAAAEAFDALTALDTKRGPEYRYFAAKAVARNGQNDEARLRYQKLAAEQGVFADHAHYQLARLHWFLGERAQAISGLSSYLKRFGRKGQNTSRAKYDLAIFRLAEGNSREAAKDLLQLRDEKKDPRERARLDELLGLAQLAQKDFTQAEASFRRAIEGDPISLAASLASLRLEELKRPAPTPLEAPRPSSLPPLAVELPDAARRLTNVGLDREAELSLQRATRAMPRLAEERQHELECELFGKLERAELRYRLAQTHASVRELRYFPLGPSRWHWDCLFPTPYRELVNEAARESQVSRALIYAVMRQESAFRSDVFSGAGAVGLMQLIPPTATRAAEELGVALQIENLRAPALNIRLGAYYLKRLLTLFQGEMTLSVAAYNAGPLAVIGWLERFGDLPLDLFVPSIPYEETRNYVYRVMTNLARYELLEHGQLETLRLSLQTPAPPERSSDLY